jgi:hypothetical protein
MVEMLWPRTPTPLITRLSTPRVWLTTLPPRSFKVSPLGRHRRIDANSLARTLLALADGRDYVYSSWKDSDLHNWLVKKNLVRSTPVQKRDDLLEAIRRPYAEATSNVYDTWSDSYIVSSLYSLHYRATADTRLTLQRNWLAKHGVVKSKTANTRDELIDLISRNYYGARDTTYNSWSDSAIRHWLESRGLVKPSEIKKPEE